MKKLKDKILASLDNRQQLEKLLNELSKYQQVLQKNYSNPVFSKNFKKRILNSYDDLQNLGKSMYRLSSFLQHNNIENAEKEKEKENVKNLVLKGGISNTRYIWHSENGESTCDEVAQRESEISNILAMGAGYFREATQWVDNLVIKQKTWEEACEEYLDDTHANKQGLELGKQNPNEDCAIIIKSVWPKIIRKN